MKLAGKINDQLNMINQKIFEQYQVLGNQQPDPHDLVKATEMIKVKVTLVNIKT